MKPTATAPLYMTDTVGTYQFLSPESCSGEPYDPFVADIWAVGVIVFVFLFGKLPFQGDTTRELFDAIARCDLVVPDDQRPVSGECRDLLVRLLSKDASQRISIGDALQHPWLLANDNDEDEPPSF
jgi:calcium/calmodulin-dependent protein kinase kinase 2